MHETLDHVGSLRQLIQGRNNINEVLTRSIFTFVRVLCSKILVLIRIHVFLFSPDILDARNTLAEVPCLSWTDARSFFARLILTLYLGQALTLFLVLLQRIVSPDQRRGPFGLEEVMRVYLLHLSVKL